MTTQNLLTTRDAAKFVGISEACLRHHVLRRNLKAVKVFRDWGFEREELVRFITARNAGMFQVGRPKRNA